MCFHTRLLNGGGCGDDDDDDDDDNDDKGYGRGSTFVWG